MLGSDVNIIGCCVQYHRVHTIEEGRERQVTSYLRQWTQLIRLHRWGVVPVQPYSCPEMWLYWLDYSHLCSLISCVHWRRYDVTCRSLPLGGILDTLAEKLTHRLQFTSLTEPYTEYRLLTILLYLILIPMLCDWCTI